jgi:hypothetical protein
VDPVALIVTALAAGAGAAVQDEAPDAIKDAYAQLQDGVRRRLALCPDAELVLAQHGADPQAGHVLLASKLARAGAGNDAGLTAAAVALMELVDAAGTQAGKYVLTAFGSQGVQVGGGNSQVNYFGQEYIDQRRAVEAAGASGGRPAGRLLAEITDPFALEVHRPVQAVGQLPGLPTLPTYVRREHDCELAKLVRAAAAGASGIAVLVGGSSTGKTRACWEALELLREQSQQWRLWHPIDPSRPEAALRELASIGPRTVVWLNEAQFYLDVAADGLGEQIAAGLREALRDPARAPVLVLATVWPQFWDRLTARPPIAVPDPRAQARELLAGSDVSVPAAFTAVQLQDIEAAGDPRLALAARAAEDRQVIQFLAGAPELMARYRNAPPSAAALISTAIDARRLGMGIALPLAFLEMAAPGYLSGADWDALPEDWLEQSLAYTAAPSKGIRGPLARIRPRSAIGAAEGPVYRLADYLEQHGRRVRRSCIPPASFWDAAACFASPGDLPALAGAADDRGLLRDAARLRKRATAHGDTSAAVTLVRRWRLLHPHSADPNPARWAATHATLNGAGGLAQLLDTLREAGAEQQIAEMLIRDPAAQVVLGGSHSVIQLLRSLRAADAHEQAASLAARAATHASLDRPYVIASLLRALSAKGTHGQAAALLARDPAAHTPLGDPDAVASLFVALRTSAEEQAAALAARAAADVPLDHPYAVANLLDTLKAAGAEPQAAELAARAATGVPLDDPNAVANLLAALKAAGAEPQAAELAARAAAHTPLEHPNAVANLLAALKAAGAHEKAAELAARAAAQAPLEHPMAIADLLRSLRNAGAEQQIAALAARAQLDHPAAVTSLLVALRAAGAEQQIAALAIRAQLDHPDVIARLLEALKAAGAKQPAAELAARAATGVPLDDPSAIANLLGTLKAAGAEPQAAELAARAAAHTPLEHPNAIADLLVALLAAGAHEDAASLAARVPLSVSDAVSHVLAASRNAGTQEREAELAAWNVAGVLNHPDAVTHLLMALKAAGDEQQAAELVAQAAVVAALTDDHTTRGARDAVTHLLRALKAAGDEVPTAELAAHVPLDRPDVIARLLEALKAEGDEQPAAELAARAATGVPLDDPSAIANLLRTLKAEGDEQPAAELAARAATGVSLYSAPRISRLLEALRKVGAERQVRVLTDRLPAEGYFALFCKQADHEVMYRFGREPDGRPASAWGWEDLNWPAPTPGL